MKFKGLFMDTAKQHARLCRSRTMLESRRGRRIGYGLAFSQITLPGALYARVGDNISWSAFCTEL